MPILDARHDFAHPVEGDTAWSESYYFNAYCPVADAGLLTRIGVRPNEGTMDVGLSVWLPNNELAHVVAVREQKEMVDAGLDVGGVRYERIEPLKTGGTLIRLNDRCVLVFAVMVLPICQIGKIPARGDLFEHMDDPPVLGAPPPPP